MITERILYNPKTDEIVLMKVYEENDSVLWTFEFFEDMELYTFDINAAIQIVLQFEQVGDL
jgi:hypothetical protein